MDKRGRDLTRMVLKYVHTTTACIWIGSGLCVLVLLHDGRQTGDSDELFALNSAIASIDDLLIKPSAAGAFVSGLLLCLLTNWKALRHRWVMVKLILTLAAIVFGALCLGPWLRELSFIAAADRMAVFDDLKYASTCQIGYASGILQTALLLLLLLLSIFKPSFSGRGSSHPCGTPARTMYTPCKGGAAGRVP